MKTDHLEEFIKTHREEFDHLEPSPKMWDNISKTKQKPKTIRLNTVMLRVAAVVAVIVVTSVLLYKTNLLTPGKLAETSADPELKELMEAEAYYAQEVTVKLKEIKKCYNTNPELKDEVESDLNELQDMYNTLKLDLRENISKKTVIEAMIENNRIRLKLVDQVLTQINC